MLPRGHAQARPPAGPPVPAAWPECPPRGPRPQCRCRRSGWPSLALLLRNAALGDRREVDDLVDVRIRVAELLTWEADELPADKVAVATVDRLAEDAFKHVAAHELEERLVATGEPKPATLEGAERGILLGGAELSEGRAHRRGAVLVEIAEPLVVGEEIRVIVARQCPIHVVGRTRLGGARRVRRGEDSRRDGLQRPVFPGAERHRPLRRASGVEALGRCRAHEPAQCLRQLEGSPSRDTYRCERPKELAPIHLPMEVRASYLLGRHPCSLPMPIPQVIRRPLPPRTACVPTRGRARVPPLHPGMVPMDGPRALRPPLAAPIILCLGCSRLPHHDLGIHAKLAARGAWQERVVLPCFEHFYPHSPMGVSI